MNQVAQKSGLALIEEAYAQDNLHVTCVGAGYVGALTAITMAVKNPKVTFTVCDINQLLI
jgi:UDP-N-acetyl-D-mannosaminuronate dehydrogenase